AEQRDYLETVRTSADALLALLNDILDFSKIEAGKLELDSHSFRLRSCVADVLKTLAIAARRKGLALEARVRPDVPDALVGDAGRLRQIVMNLVGNAIKFTERGEVVVHAALESRADQQVELHFTVADTGIGIPLERQQGL